MSFNTVISLFICATFLILGGVISSCGSSGADNSPQLDNAKKKVKRKVVEVGKVATINDVEKFVLIKMQYGQMASKHALLYVEAGERKATLSPTGEKIGSFVAADIIKGGAEVGDGVIAVVYDGQGESKSLTPLSSPAPED